MIMAQYGHRKVTNTSDHAIAGLQPGESVQGGGLEGAHMAVSIQQFENVHEDGSTTHGYKLYAETLMGENNKDKDGNTLNKVPNVSPSGHVESSHYAFTQKLDENKQPVQQNGLPVRNTGITISETQAKAYREALEAASGGSGPNYTESKDNHSKDTYVVQADLNRVTGARSIGAMPKVDTIRPSTAVVPETAEEFKDNQKKAREELKKELESGGLTVEKVEREKDSAEKAAKPAPTAASKTAGERKDVLVRIDLDKDGNIPTAPAKNGRSYTHAQMIAQREDGGFDYTSPSTKDPNTGRKSRKNFLTTDEVSALLDKGSNCVVEHGTTKDGTPRSSVVVSANVELKANNKGFQNINLGAGVQPSKTTPEVTPDTWKDAKARMKADYEASQSMDGKDAGSGFKFADTSKTKAAETQAAAPAAPAAPAGRSAGHLDSVAEAADAQAAASNDFEDGDDDMPFGD